MMKISMVRFIKSNRFPATGEHATAKYFVDQSIDEPTLVRINQNKDFNNKS